MTIDGDWWQLMAIEGNWWQLMVIDVIDVLRITRLFWLLFRYGFIPNNYLYMMMCWMLLGNKQFMIFFSKPWLKQNPNILFLLFFLDIFWVGVFLYDACNTSLFIIQTWQKTSLWWTDLQEKIHPRKYQERKVRTRSRLQ